MIGPYSIAWMFKRVNKLVPDVVGHIPQEISRFVWFFIEFGGTVYGEVVDGKCHRSPIANSGLEILLMVTFGPPDVKRRYLEQLIDLINKNYKTPNYEAVEFSDELSLHAEHIEHMSMDWSL